MKAPIDEVNEYQPRNELWVLLAQSMILATFILVAILYPGFYFHPEGLVYLVCVLLFVLFAWTLLSWRALTGNLFDPYILFMLSAFAFNAGLAFLEVFHLNKGGIFNGLFSQQTILMTLLLVTIGLTAFHSGALVAVFMKDRKAKPSRATWEQVQDVRSLRLVGWALIGIAIIPTVLVLKQSISVVTSSGYMGLFQQQHSVGLDAWPRALSGFLVPGSLFLLAGSKGKRSGVFVSFCIILSYSAVLFFLGERGYAIMPIVAYLWLWHRIIHKVPRAVLAAVAILLIVVLIPLVAAFRGVSGQERYSLVQAVDVYKSVEDPALAGLSEMGESMNTVSYTIRLVPETRSYDKGASYYYGLLRVVPNLFWRVHPADARGLASDWLTQMVNPYFAAHGGGLGYTFIAEAYLNFGWWGTVIMLGLMGFLFGGLVLWADWSGDFARLAMVASFLSFFLFFARSESADVFRPLVWYSLLPYLAVRFFGSWRTRLRSKSI